MAVVVARVGQRDLMGPEGALDLCTIDDGRTRPALRRAHHDHRPPPAIGGNVTAASPPMYGVDLIQAAIDGGGHRLMDGPGVVARDHDGVVAVTPEQVEEVVLG